MKTLDFENRTRVARESIRTVCNAVGVALKDRRKVSRKLFHIYLTEIFKQFSYA